MGSYLGGHIFRWAYIWVGLYLGGLIFGWAFIWVGFYLGGLLFGWAFIWVGLYLGGLIFRWAYSRSFTVLYIYCRGGGCNKRVGREIKVFMSVLFDR